MNLTDYDDVSLLAATSVPELEAQMEEEIDDVSLLTAAVEPEPETKQTLVVDYLEGMTSEMFGDDDELDQSDVHDEDEEVEALPDSHFGLLGSSRELLQPQGCIEYLPEEVLRQILCILPAHDLYRNVSLVCHRWRNIVQDPKVEQITELHYVLLAESILFFFYGLTKVL